MNKCIDECALAWLAGIIEGEGTVSIYHQKRKGNAPDQLRATISITNTDPHLISRCNEIFNTLGCNVHINQYDNKKGSTRTVYDMQTAKQEYVKKICEAVIPYMVGEKLAKAKLVLSFVQRRLERLGSNRDTRKAQYDDTDWETFTNIRSSQTTREANQG